MKQKTINRFWNLLVELKHKESKCAPRFMGFSLQILIVESLLS
jgi:hypothetical protein